MAQTDYIKLTPAQARRLGFSPSAERYRPKGAPLTKSATISRRQYDNLSGRYDAFGGRAQFERRYKIPNYRYYVERMLAIEGKKPTPSNVKRFSSSTSKENLIAYKAAKAKKRGGRAYRNPKGDFARFLTYIGARDKDVTYDVGDTPPAG